MPNVTLVYIGPHEEVELYLDGAPGQPDDWNDKLGWHTVERGGELSVPDWKADSLLEQPDNWRRKGKAPAKSAAKAATERSTRRRTSTAPTDVDPVDPPPESTDSTDHEGDAP